MCVCFETGWPWAHLKLLILCHAQLVCGFETFKNSFWFCSYGPGTDTAVPALTAQPLATSSRSLRQVFPSFYHHRAPVAHHLCPPACPCNQIILERASRSNSNQSWSLGLFKKILYFANTHTLWRVRTAGTGYWTHIIRTSFLPTGLKARTFIVVVCIGFGYLRQGVFV